MTRNGLIMPKRDAVDHYAGEVKRHLRLAGFAKNKSQKNSSIRKAKLAAKTLWRLVRGKEEYDKRHLNDKINRDLLFY
jgi:hypothetical protein